MRLAILTVASMLVSLGFWAADLGPFVQVLWCGACVTFGALERATNTKGTR